MTSKLNNIFEPIDDIYMLSHSIGRMPISGPEILKQQLLDPWASNGNNIWDTWISGIKGFNQSLSKLFNANAEEFCPQTNISSGLTKILNALPAPSPNKNIILISENAFPTTGYVCQMMRSRGFQVKFIPKKENHQSLVTWSQHLNDQVHSVFITHVHYNNGIQVPVEGIVALAKLNSCYTIIDVAQSAGILPIDFSSWDADVVIGTCIKWLCGGPGAGWVWVNPRIIHEMKPNDIGWFSHSNPFEFDIHNFEYANDSARFWGGTPSVASYILASNSIRTLTEIGIHKIHEHNQALIATITKQLNPETIVSPVDTKLRGGTLVVAPRDRKNTEKKLIEAGVKFDSRKFGIRLSPHIYVTIEQAETVRECLLS